MNCAILSFFDKLHLTPPDNKLGRAGWEVDNTSGCTKVLSRCLFFCDTPHLTTFDNKSGRGANFSLTILYILCYEQKRYAEFDC